MNKKTYFLILFRRDMVSVLNQYEPSDSREIIQKYLEHAIRIGKYSADELRIAEF